MKEAYCTRCGRFTEVSTVTCLCGKCLTRWIEDKEDTWTRSRLPPRGAFTFMSRMR